MHRVGEHPVPAGPLAVRWLGWELLDPPRAGATSPVELELENAGTASWRSDAERRIEIGYHWLDDRGNALVWGGLWAPLPHEVPPGQRVRRRVELRAPLGTGRYTLAFDLVDEGRRWLSELGNRRLELEVDVQPRIARRALAVTFTPGPPELVTESSKALEAQDEPLVPLGEEVALAHVAPGCVPASADWSRRVLDAHAEGYAVVGGSVETPGRRRSKALEPWRPGVGRVPHFAHPLLCPSLIHGAEPYWAWLEDVQGLPALQHPQHEPWLYDGRISLKARPRSGRRPG
jgi:hypothetical protein